MPMHRRQSFDASPGSVAVTAYSSTLHGVFRKAVGYALASALGVSGCYASEDQSSSQPSAATGTGGTGQGARLQPQVSPPAQPSKAIAGAAGAGAPVEQHRLAPTQPSAADAGGPMQTSAVDAGTPMQHAPRPTPFSPTCVDRMPQLFAGLTGQPFDAAEFRVQSESSDLPQIWFGQGALCGAATDPTACQSQVAVAAEKQNLLFADYLPMFGMTARYVLTTFGNEVHKYQTREELLQFLGPIDSPQDALLLLYYDHRGVLCEPVDRTQSFSGVDAATFVELDDGYQVLVVNQLRSCEGHDDRARDPARRDRWHRDRDRTREDGAGDDGLRRPAARRAALAARRHERVGAGRTLCQHGPPRRGVDRRVRDAGGGARSTRRAGRAGRLGASCRRRRGTPHRDHSRACAALRCQRATTAEVAPIPLRSLEAIAIDNAREGCVRECFGAALGCYQAQSAGDPEIAAAMAEIAEDETRHAALAFAIDAWVQPRLDDRGRARVAAARAHAVSALRSELACVPDAVTRAALGLPDAVAALRLYTCSSSRSGPLERLGPRQRW